MGGARLYAVIVYIGQHTMPILIFHFLAFKLVSFAGVAVTGEPWCKIASFPNAYVGFWWCAAYTAVGVALPLALAREWGEVRNEK